MDPIQLDRREHSDSFSWPQGPDARLGPHPATAPLSPIATWTRPSARPMDWPRRERSHHEPIPCARGYHPLPGHWAARRSATAPSCLDVHGSAAKEAYGLRHRNVVEPVFGLPAKSNRWARRCATAGPGDNSRVRADSGTCLRHSTVNLRALRREMDVRFSITIRQRASLRDLIEAIPEEDWTPIPYWMDGAADVADHRLTPRSRLKPDFAPAGNLLTNPAGEADRLGNSALARKAAAA